jgi:hypothetical protein
MYLSNIGANVIRCALTLQQVFYNRKIDITCVTQFNDDVIIASPFNNLCLDYAEIIMLTLVALSVLVAVIVLISNLVLFQRLNNYRSFAEQSTENIRETPEIEPEVESESQTESQTINE